MRINHVHPYDLSLIKELLSVISKKKKKNAVDVFLFFFFLHGVSSSRRSYVIWLSEHRTKNNYNVESQSESKRKKCN